jgi:hypothetical protein
MPGMKAASIKKQVHWTCFYSSQNKLPRLRGVIYWIAAVGSFAKLWRAACQQA